MMANPSSCMIFYELKDCGRIRIKRPSHGPMQTPMHCFYTSKDSRFNKLSNNL